MYQHKEIKFTVPGLPPSKSNGYRIGKYGFFKDTKVAQYEQSFRIAVRGVKKMTFAETDRLSAQIKWYAPHLRSDLDGICKVIFDCCQRELLIANDNKLDYIELKRMPVDKKNPRIEVVIWSQLYECND